MAVSVAARPRRVDAERNRERIIAAAIALFARDGVGASLDEIARSAGVGPGTLYRHFPNRDYLVAAALRETAETLLAVGAELDHEPCSITALRVWLDAMIDHARTYQGLSASVMQLALEPDETVMPGCSEIRHRTDHLLRRAQAAGAVDVAWTIDDLATFANAIAWALDQTGGGRDERDRLLDRLCGGLVVPPGDRRPNAS